MSASSCVSAVAKAFATDVFLRMNGWRMEVVGPEAHAFLVGLLERGEADFQHLLPWIKASLVRL